MKTLKKIAFGTMALALAFNLTSCEKDKDEDPPVVDTDPLQSYVKIGQENFHNGGLTLHLYMKEDPFVGYNRVAVRVTETEHNNVVDNATVMFLPVMDMGTMMHTTPVANPVYDTDMEAYLGSATFIMSSTAGNWMFNVIAGPSSAMVDTLSFDITVEEKDEARLYNFVSAADNTTSYFVALKEPMNPEVGLNDFELMIYRRESMMSFPPATNLKVEIKPEMPAMNHGSPNNENPMHVEDGLYRGKANFTMSGYWKVNIKIMDGNDAVLDDDGSFDISFQ